MTRFPKVLAFLLVAALLVDVSCRSRGDRLEDWETASKLFKIRVTAYDEKGVFLSGTYYVFESARVDSDNWREFMTLRHDDRPKIPKDQLRFVNDRIGYVFMGWMYGATTDGGNSWSIWDATRDVPDWQWSKYGVVRDVRIEPDGSGVMLLKPIADPNIKAPTFRTHDFGRHWQVE